MSLIKQLGTVVLTGNVLLTGLTGCMATQHPAIPESGLTLPELYRHTTQPTAMTPVTAQVSLSQPSPLAQSVNHLSDNLAPMPQPNYTGYTRTARNEINTLFQPQPNPSIPIYIYPHLTQMGDEMIPVPGYTSSFFLYKQNRYQLSTRY